MNFELIGLISREHRKSLLTAALLFVLSLVVWYIHHFMQTVTLSALQASRDDKRNQVAASGKRDASAAFQKGREDIKSLLARLPSRTEFPQVLGQLVDTAKVSGVSLDGLSYKPQKGSADGLLAYTLTCTAGGNYPALKRFLAELQGFDGLTVVTSINLTNNDLAVAKATMQVNLSIYLRDSAQ